MPIRRLASIALAVFAVAFVAANLIALPFASFSNYSSLWAQVYGTSTSSPCGSYFDQLPDELAKPIASVFPPPTSGAQWEAVFHTNCGKTGILDVSDFTKEGLTCNNVVVYRITDVGTLAAWPITCSADGSQIIIPGTGKPGHLILYKVADPSKAPASVTLTGGA